MNNEEAFLAWSPSGVRWSDWAKPVAFAQALPPATGDSPPSALGPWQSIPLDWLPPASDTAIVADLPGTLAVSFGMAVAEQGYRPIPLFNACTGPAEIVDMQQLIRALFEAADKFAEMSIPERAPPAFLIDANRLQGGNNLQPGRFDNRWMVFPQDFPSAHVLLSERIQQVLLVRNGPVTVPDDLAHVLLRWKEGGIELLGQDAQGTGPPQPLTVSPPKGFKSLWYRLLAMAGLRRNSAGGFGSVIPQVASGAGIG